MKEFVEKLIGRLEEKLIPDKECFEYEDDYMYAEERHNKMLEIVNQLAEEYINCSTDTSSGWIPCSERLPEGKESHKVLVTDEDGIMAVCYFLEVTKIFKVCWDGEEFQGVVAWQPLPAPYQPND